MRERAQARVKALQSVELLADTVANIDTDCDPSDELEDALAVAEKDCRQLARLLLR